MIRCRSTTRVPNASGAGSAAIWAGRSRVDVEWWRLYFVVLHEGAPIGMQDLIGVSFRSMGTVTTFSWLGLQHQGQGLGREMRERFFILRSRDLEP